MNSVLLPAACLTAVVSAAPVLAQVSPEMVRQLQEKVEDSLVVVEFTYDYEMGRQELRGLGVVIDDQGTILTPIEFVTPQFPDSYLTNFKITLPADGDKRVKEVEFDAVLAARDERYDLAFIRPAEGVEHDWQPIEFVGDEVLVGEPMVCVSRMGEAAAYQSYVTTPSVMAKLRGPIPQVLISPDGLGMPGSPVFNADGKAVGLVHAQQDQMPFLDIQGAGMTVAFYDPPRLFIPASDFLPAMENIPAADEPIKLPWLGVAALEGVEKDLAKFLDIEGVTAVTIGDVIDGYPAAEAGLQNGDIVVKVDGEELQRADTPEEAPEIFTRTLSRMPIGSEVELTVLRGAGEDAAEENLTVTLTERPTQQGQVDRNYLEDLGFTARGVVFSDTYERQLDPDTEGVVVSFIRPQSAAATASPEGLELGDLVTKLNTDAVTDLASFTEAYEAFREESPSEAVVLEVLRGIDTRIIRIEPPQE